MMKTLMGLIFTLLTGFSCSLAPTQSFERAPASVSSTKGCRELASHLVGESAGLKASELRTLKSLDTQWVDQEPELKELVFLNRSPKLKQKSRQILSLLKREYPEEGPQALARRYRNLFKDC